MMPVLMMIIIEDEKSKVKFEQIYRTYGKRMWFIANEILNDAYASEDAVQDALIGIAKNISAIDEVESKKTFAYISVAVKHSAYNIAKKKKDIVIDLQDYFLSGESDNNGFDNLEANDLVTRALLKVPENYREVLYLKFVLEMKSGDIALILGEKKATIRQKIKRGRQMFIIAYEKEVNL